MYRWHAVSLEDTCRRETNFPDTAVIIDMCKRMRMLLDESEVLFFSKLAKPYAVNSSIEINVADSVECVSCTHGMMLLEKALNNSTSVQP